MLKRWTAFLLAWLAILSPAYARPPLVLAAASLQESLEAAADAWAAKGHEKPVLSFAASSALARQIIASAPADIFISADEEWMDAVAAKGLIRSGSRADIAGNRLVLIAPGGGKNFVDPVSKRFPLAKRLGDGRLAMGDPSAVPAGKYGKAALISLGLWSGIETKVAPAENVRAALKLVERSEAPLGIVYATDARASKSVHVIGVFPRSSHLPIRYPIGILATSSSQDAEGFRRFLISHTGQAILQRFGFLQPKR